MLHYLFLTLLLLFCLSPLYGQQDFTQTGVAKLIIRSDSMIDERNAPQLSIGSSFVLFRPIGFTRSGDEYEANIYTFGPATGNLRMLGKTYIMVLLPGETSIIYVNRKESIDHIGFEGYLKEVFDDSDLIMKFTTKVLNHYNPEPDYKLYTHANHYRDDQMRRFESRAALYLKYSGLEGFSKTLAVSNLNFFLKSYLIEYHVYLNNLNVGLDTEQSKRYIPARKLDYYDKLIAPELNDTLSLIFTPYYELMSNIIQDSLMKLPDLKTNHPIKFRSMLSDYLFDYIGQRDGLFYDMATATAYINQLDRLDPLTDLQKRHIGDYFTNTAISDYIFHENDHVLKSIADNQKQEYAVYLESKEKGDLLMKSILSSQNSKVTIVDFWATWCGPCIEAFRTSAHIKKKYAENHDVRFIYITDESSEPKLWNDYVKVVGGEHHYIYKGQMRQIYDSYDFSILPTYLIYDKNGELIKKISGHFNNDELVGMIEANLK